LLSWFNFFVEEHSLDQIINFASLAWTLHTMMFLRHFFFQSTSKACTSYRISTIFLYTNCQPCILHVALISIDHFVQFFSDLFGIYKWKWRDSIMHRNLELIILLHISINLLAFYHECHFLIGYANHYLFCNR